MFYFYDVKTRWRFWLLPLLTVCFFISAFEVNTDEIVNSWGDTYDAYLPVEYVADGVESATISPWRHLGSIIQAFRPTAQSAYPLYVFYWSNTRIVSLHCERIYLRYCQWLI